jgi:hypothetical protein
VTRRLRRHRDIPQAELVNDHERDRSVLARRRRSALAQRQSASTGFAMKEAAVPGVQVLPGPIGLDGRAIEVAGLEFVEAVFDQNRYLPAVQGDVDRLPGAQKVCADG